MPSGWYMGDGEFRFLAWRILMLDADDLPFLDVVDKAIAKFGDGDNDPFLVVDSERGEFTSWLGVLGPGVSSG